MKYVITYIFTALTVFSACKNDWLDVNPKGKISDDLFTETSVQGLLVGVYNKLDGKSFGQWEYDYAWSGTSMNWVWGSVASDDAYKGTTPGDQPPINPIEDFTVSAANRYVQTGWAHLYSGIRRANSHILIISRMKGLNETTKKQALAQLYFLQSFFYFELLKKYRKIPYIDEMNFGEAETVKQSERSEVYQRIEEKLKVAVTDLPERWKGEPGKATKWAAQTLLGQVYMFQQKFSEAKTALLDVYNNGGFTLMDYYEQNYLARHNNNRESIFELQFSVNDGTSMAETAGIGGGLNFPLGEFGSCCGFFQPSQSFVNSFRTDANGLPDFGNFTDNIPATDPTGNPINNDGGTVDVRLDFTVGRPGHPFLDHGPHPGTLWIRDINNGGPFLYKKNMWLKAEEKTARATNAPGWQNGLNDNNFRKFRLAHVILFLAECEAEGGNLPKAMEYVNMVRNRAKNSINTTNSSFLDKTKATYRVEPYSSFADKADALKKIRHEMRVEFGMEGMRFFDLVRWGEAAEVMNAYLNHEGKIRNYLSGKSFTKGKNEYWPIPQAEIDNSSGALTQDPNY